MQSASRKTAYLTIDDAPTDDFPRKVDYLLAKGVPAIFFCCTGDRLEKGRPMVVEAIHKGFVLGNHTWSHFCDFRDHADRSQKEILRMEALLDDIYAVARVARPAKLFRFPGLEKGVPGWPYYQPVAKPSPEQQQVHDRAQAFLRSAGFRQPQWQVAYRWYQHYGAHLDTDCDCTYDSFDWGPLLPDTRYCLGYNTLEKILARTDEEVPEDGRGLNDQRSDEIIMIHDLAGIEHVFEPLMERLLGKPMRFALPAF